MEFIENPDSADFFLLGLPIDQGTENQGCSEAPSQIRKGFDNIFLSENGNIRGVYDHSDVVEEDKFEDTMDKIFNKTRELLKARKPMIFLGGNHSVTIPIVQAYSRHFDKIGVVFIDAHPDCQPGYYPYGDVIGSLNSIDEVTELMLVGIRNWSRNEYQFLIENRIPFITMQDIFEKKMDYILDRIKEQMSDVDAIYISLDIDAIDPAFAPATGWIEPGGLSSRQTLQLIKELAKLKKVAGLDIVEVNPAKDVNNMTSILSAKIISEFIGSYKK